MGNPGDLIKWTCHDMSIFSMEFTVDLDDLTIFNIFEASESAAKYLNLWPFSDSENDDHPWDPASGVLPADLQKVIDYVPWLFRWSQWWKW